MSVQAIAWAYDQQGLDMSAKFLLVTLANFSNHANECWPSKHRLANEMGCSESTVCKHLLTLQEKGLIRIHKRHKDGTQLASLIRLSIGRANDVSYLDGEDNEWGLIETEDRRSAQSEQGSASRRGGGSERSGVVRVADHGVVRHAEGGGPPRGDKPSLNRKEDSFLRASDPDKPAKQTDSKRGSRLPANWSLPADWRSWAQINFSADDAAVTLEAERFRDYWIAKPGAAGCKLDWQATWRNWCRNAKVPATLVRRPAASMRPTEADEMRRLRAIAGPVEAWA